MHSFRRLALLLALILSAASAALAQSSSSSSDSATPSNQAEQPTQGQLTVQARVKARRAQRRAAAIHDVYSHLYEAYAGYGYLRFTPGPLQRVNQKSWDVGITRYYDERLGVTVDGRGIYGNVFIEPQTGNPPAGSIGITHPEIHQYTAMIGPTYRFYLQPKYSVSGRVMGGFARGIFSSSTSGNTQLSTGLGLYPDSLTYAASASVVTEYNLTSNVGLRVAPEYLLTGFGSKAQNSLGFTSGLVIRFGKQ